MKRRQKVLFLLAIFGVVLTPILLLATGPSTSALRPADESGGSGSSETKDTTKTSDTELSNPIEGSDCGDVDTSIIKCDASNNGTTTDNGIWALLLIALNILTAGVGIIAVAGIVYGSILYASAEDKADQVKKAVDIIRNTIIGLVLFALMYASLNFIVPGGVFSDAAAPTSPSAGSSSNPKETNSDVDGRENAENSPRPSLPAGSCYTVTSQHGRQTQGRVFHQSGNQTYAFENSLEGIRYAKNHNYDSIDLDIRVTKDGIPVATHWEKPMRHEGFYDPQRQLSQDASVSNMTYEQVSRLRNRDGQRIYSLEDMIAELDRQNLNLTLEIKTPRSISGLLPEIASMLNDADVKTAIRGFGNVPGMLDAFAEARKVGFWTHGIYDRPPWEGPKANGKCS